MAGAGCAGPRRLLGRPAPRLHPADGAPLHRAACRHPLPVRRRTGARLRRHRATRRRTEEHPHERRAAAQGPRDAEQRTVVLRLQPPRTDALLAGRLTWVTPTIVDGDLTRRWRHPPRLEQPMSTIQTDTSRRG